MLPPILLQRLRVWWRVGHAQGKIVRNGWLFPGLDPMDPLSTRQLNRAIHAAADTAKIDKRVSMHTLRHTFATHPLENKVDIRVIQVLLGHAKLDITSIYTHVATDLLREVISPLENLPPSKAGCRGQACPDGCRDLPSAWPGLARRPARPTEPGPDQGDVGHRAVPQRGAGYGANQVSYNCCRNRHCPKCKGSAAKRWLQSRQADLLPVEYYHVASTLPARIVNIAHPNKAVVYGLLVDLAAEVLLTIAADPKHPGARIGATLMLHTWGSPLTHHPHVHGIEPGGGLAPDGKTWVACRPRSFLSVRVLSRLFRRHFLEELLRVHHGHGRAWRDLARFVGQRRPYLLALAGVVFSVLAAFLKSLSLGASLLPDLFMCSSLPFAMRSCFA